MRSFLLSLLATAALLAGGGCKSVECGDGTIESGGDCVPADETVSTAKCGAGTKLVGDTCAPATEPTTCGPGTVREPDPQTGVGVCKPSGAGGGCGAPLSCPPPDPTKQTICGQLYDFETSERFEAAAPTGARCTAAAAAGPCAVGIRAYDAVQFASNPSGAPPLAVDDVYIDDCGRYRLTNITPPAATTPFIGLGIDDATAGPGGVTNAVGLATRRDVGKATADLEAFIVRKATTDAWAATGGPSIATGMYTMVFRARSKGAALNPGVTVTKNGAAIPASTRYLSGCSSLRLAVDPAATVTGGTGTALVTGASLADGAAYSGAGGLPAECTYSLFPGVTLPGIVFVQILRPISAAGMTCLL